MSGPDDGIILAAQRSWPLPDLIATLDCALCSGDAAELTGQIRWLNDWRR